MSGPNQETRTPTAEQPKNQANVGPGPFEAKVVNHLDSEYMGTIEVELLKQKSSGNTPGASGEKIPVRYLSPFYGVTSFSGSSENEGYDYTQKSYGFWAVPPDIGTKVLVIFAEGDRGQGFWIGCIQDQNMNFMVPGNASTKFNQEDQTKARPVAEYNKKTEAGTGNDPTQYLKPCNTDACAVLDNNGLANDPIRGTTTSSARRETPSMVFGWSSPGPLDRRPGKPKVKTGETSSQIDAPASRLTGTTIVMDDGDPSMYRQGPAKTMPSVYKTLEAGGDPMWPMNEHFRIRTRTGHQLLFHNAEDIVYLAHGSGDSWIEMTANGKIDIYSKDSISIHTENDFNFKADRDINIEAGNNINLKAGNQMAIETKANWTVKCGADGMLTCTGSSNIKSAAHKETADRIDMNGPPAAEASAAPVPVRVPKRGEWTGQENKNPEQQVPKKTNSDPKKIEEGESNKTSDDKAEDVKPEDTFKKCPPVPVTEAEQTQQERQTTEEASAPESSNATVVENGQTQPEQPKPKPVEEKTANPRENEGTATLVNNEGQTQPPSEEKTIALRRDANGNVVGKTVEVKGVDADGFEFTETKNVPVSPGDAATAEFEYEFDSGQNN